eukprot:NODE_767_length_4055_cov_0.722952.p1 type:complete len:597 gc:universal NODE_767_length_4055_cov_0.722952:1530-3320(+)
MFDINCEIIYQIQLNSKKRLSIVSLQNDKAVKMHKIEKTFSKRSSEKLKIEILSYSCKLNLSRHLVLQPSVYRIRCLDSLSCRSDLSGVESPYFTSTTEQLPDMNYYKITSFRYCLSPKSLLIEYLEKYSFSSDNWFRETLMTAILRACKSTGINSLLFLFGNSVLEGKLGNLKIDVENVLDKFGYVMDKAFVEHFLRAEMKNLSFNSTRDALCIICYRAFCSHMVTSYGLTTSSTIAPKKVVPKCKYFCGNNCYASKREFDKEKIFKFVKSSEFTSPEMIHLISALNGSCEISNILKIPCHILFEFYSCVKGKDFPFLQVVINKKEKETRRDSKLITVQNTNYAWERNPLSRNRDQICQRNVPKKPLHICVSTCEINGGNTYFAGCDCYDFCGSACICLQNRFECDPSKCRCCNIEDDKLSFNILLGDSRCKNLNLSRELILKLEPFNSELHGLGLRSMQSIPKYGFIGFYSGELRLIEEADIFFNINRVLTEEEIKRSNHRKAVFKNAVNQIYFQNILSYKFTLSELFEVDAKFFGNELRFANESRDVVNSEPKYLNTATGNTLIGLYAQKRISAGEEIIFDYGDAFKSTRENY